MIDITQTHPLTDFLRNHKAHIARLKESGTPEVLTINGKAEVVVQDAAQYQEMVRRLQRLETITALQEGIAAADRGELRDAADMIADIRSEYGLPR